SSPLDDDPDVFWSFNHWGIIMLPRFRRSVSGVALSAAVLACASVQPALAQTSEPVGEADDSIIVTAQRANQTQVARGGNVGVLGNKAAEDVPFVVKSFNSALILNQQPQSLGQVLENDPSIRTSNAFGTAAEVFVMRGFVLFSDDVGFNGLYGLTPRQLVAPELYETVQVLNGANAFLNGAAPGGSGVGGSVNVIPKRAGDRDLNRVTLNYTGDEHFGGSFDFARRSADGALGVRVNGAARSGELSVDGEFRSAYVLGTSLDWQGERARLFLDLAFQRMHVRGLRHKVGVSTVIPRVPGAKTNYAQQWQYGTQRDLFGTIRGEFDLADNVMLYASFGARDGTEKSVAINAVDVTNAVTGAATGSNAQFTPRTDNNEAGDIGLRGKFEFAGMSHEINVGGSKVWQVSRNAYQRYFPFATNIYDPVPVPQPGPNTVVGGDLNDPFPVLRNRFTSFFVSDTIGLLDDRILFTAGLRRQTIKVTRYSYFVEGQVTAAYDKSATTPVFGLVVKPVAGLSLYANRIEGLLQGPAAPNLGNVINANEIFPPAKSVQYELGAKLGLGRFNASLALYQIEQPSAFVRPITPTPTSGPTDIFALDGEQRNRGLEIAIDGEPVKGLRIIAGLSVNDAILANTAGGVNEGNKAPGVPDYTINANVEWDLPFAPALTLTGRVVHTGRQMVNATNTLELPTWTRFDLGARYVLQVGDNPVTLRANVDNVANKRYWASGFNSFGTALLQGLPRTFKLSATIDF
ncbi:TonB-dependent siderophore receptor, partial [Sphingopyxis sp. UBA6734]|uniref:TonB-dependent receptor n=2 Tax=unclassified Sphingopyxis TaxID=2614943 RepID=UPI0032E43898